MKTTHVSLWAALALTTLVFGCDSPAPTTGPASAPAPAKPDETKKVADTKVEAKPVEIKEVKLTEKELAGIKKLPEDDQKLALAQAVCPVGGSHLGAMGMPVKLMLKGQPVFLCCDGCEDEAKEKADEVLAKIAKK